jgi:hypothetical protein
MPLKLLAFVFFCLEVVSPMLLRSADAEVVTASPVQTQLTDHSVSVDFFTQLLFEEAGKEGKEENETFLFWVCLAIVFSHLLKFQTACINWKLPCLQFDTRPALFTLHRVLII